MFRIIPLSIIRSLFTVHSAIVYVIQICRQLSIRTRNEFHLDPARKKTNTTRNIAGNLSASWQYGNNISGLPTASFLLVCKLCKNVSRETKNPFRDFCVDGKLGNTDLGDTYCCYSFMEVGSVK